MAYVNVSPTSSTAYRVMVTDALGCKQTSTEKVVKAVDVRCGGKGDKVQVCLVPPGNVGHPFSSCVDASAVTSLLKAGSRLGSCGTAEDYTVALKANPNPTYTYFTVSITSSNIKDQITLNIYDITGRVMESRTVSPNSTVQIGADYPTGVYLAEAVQVTKKATLVLVKL